MVVYYSSLIVLFPDLNFYLNGACMTCDELFTLNVQRILLSKNRYPNRLCRARNPFQHLYVLLGLPYSVCPRRLRVKKELCLS
jgi:hypothetical protein